MTEGIRKAPNRLTKPRSGGGVGKGSHSPIQALVEAPVGCVQIPDERVGFVQGVGGGVSCVQKAGGSVTCPQQAGPRPICASVTPAIPGALTGA